MQAGEANIILNRSHSVYWRYILTYLLTDCILMHMHDSPVSQV